LISSGQLVLGALGNRIVAGRNRVFGLRLQRLGRLCVFAIGRVCLRRCGRVLVSNCYVFGSFAGR